MGTKASQPKVLMTNLMLTGYSGSELHITDLASQFLKHGWDVTCFTLVTSEPTRSMLLDMGVKIVEFPHTDQLEDHYELLFAQHHVISDFIAAQKNIAFDRIAVSILGPQSFHEHIPELAAYADLIAYVSDECRQARQAEASFSPAKHYVFPNYGHDDFFNLPPREYPVQPERIAVVSNHLSKEMIELKRRTNLPFTLDFIGWADRALLVTSDMLSHYDCVITIGRTVLDCFAGSIPIYCYDHFGGPGYISPDEVERHAWYNFSGRSVERKLNGEELLSDIIAGYPKALTHLSQLRQYAFEHHNLSHNFDKLLEAILSSPSHPDPTSCSEGLEGKLRYLCDTIRVQFLQTIGTAEVFWGEELGDISEDQKELIPYRHSTVIDINLDKLNIPSHYRITRFDPHTSRCSSTILSPHWWAVNSFVREGSTDVFLSRDPAYLPYDDAEKRALSFVASASDPHRIDRELDALLEENASMKKHITELEAILHAPSLGQDIKNKIARALKKS